MYSKMYSKNVFQKCIQKMYFKNVFAVKPLKILGQFSKLKIQSSLYHEAILCHVLTYQSLEKHFP